jgi:hypothetical protein
MHTFAAAGLRSIVWAVFSNTHTHTTHCSTTPLRTCRTSRLIILASGKPDDSPVDLCGWTRRLHATRISFPRPSPAWENHCWGSPPVAFNAVAGALADPLPAMVGSRLWRGAARSQVALISARLGLIYCIWRGTARSQVALISARHGLSYCMWRGAARSQVALISARLGLI